MIPEVVFKRMATDSTLVDQTYEPLDLGEITPRGWLRSQLELQAEGLSGHLDEFWPPLADNQWLGGENDGWERGPYYADGLVPLAYLLDDEDLKTKAEKWVTGFLDWQHDDGWIGPRKPAFSRFPNDVWPRAIILKVFRQYYQATRDERVIDCALDFCRHLHECGFEDYPLERWAKFRWADLAVAVHWLYEQTDEEWLLEVSEIAADQGYDWADHFAGQRGRYSFPHPEPVEDSEMATHVVNNAMAIKEPAIRYRQSGDEAHYDAVTNTLDTLDAFHGQVTGLFTGDEHLAGRDPTRGTELCAVVEYMYSLEELVATLGEVGFADRLERIAFNALPATFTQDMWAHQYDQQANQVLCAVGDQPWTNGPDANLFGLEPHYGCCTSNYHQGWPKFTSHLWMHTDSGLAAVAYAPSAVTTRIDGTEVTVLEETDYPFEDELRFTVELDEPTAFELEVRIPEWAEDPAVELPTGESRSPEPGTFHKIEREWSDGDQLLLTLSAPVETERRYQGGVAVHRGPLVFSLPVDSEAQPLPGETDHPAAHREYHPTEAWNYGLQIDTDQPASSVSRTTSEPGSVPFLPTDPPIELSVTGSRVEDWTLDGSRAGPIPSSPTAVGDTEELTLVPYGCTTLRVTEFPLVE